MTRCLLFLFSSLNVDFLGCTRRFCCSATTWTQTTSCSVWPQQRRSRKVIWWRWSSLVCSPYSFRFISPLISLIKNGKALHIPTDIPSSPIKIKVHLYPHNLKDILEWEDMLNCAIVRLLLFNIRAFNIWLLRCWRSDLCTLHMCFVPIVLSHFPPLRFDFLSADVAWVTLWLNSLLLLCVGSLFPVRSLGTKMQWHPESL